MLQDKYNLHSAQYTISNCTKNGCNFSLNDFRRVIKLKTFSACSVSSFWLFNSIMIDMNITFLPPRMAS